MKGLRAQSRFVQREVTLLALLTVLAVGVFLVTRVVAGWDRRVTILDAAALYKLGVRQLQEGRVDEALSSLRLATTKDRGNRTYVPTLARALAAVGRTDDARQALLQLRESMPEDPDINVELARLAAGRQDLTEAMRYYHSALYGVWSDADLAAREHLHVELVRLLLQHDHDSDALAELVALSTNLPDTVPARLEVGQLLLAAGDPQRARDQFARALAREPRNQEAHAGAGEAAFGLGDYAGARDDLAEVLNPSPRLAELRDLAALVLVSDPLGPRLTLAERRQRALGVIGQVLRRLDGCTAQPAGQAAGLGARLDAARTEARRFQPTLTRRSLRDSPETVDRVVERSYRIEQTAEPCGEPTRLDQAILLIGRRHGAAPQ